MFILVGRLAKPAARRFCRALLVKLKTETEIETSSANIPRISGNFLITCYFKGFSACRPEIRQVGGTDAAVCPGTLRFPDPAHTATPKRAPPVLQRA
ncbi:MAG: hypothetical protein RSH52_09325 [Janthinobacterium sp.]